MTRDTRDRLLRAGGEVFAERGFRRGTVREIVARAGANVAAVNYHFRDKTGLYTAVLAHSAHRAVERHPPDGNLPPGAPAAERLRAFVRALLARIFDETHLAVHARLMMREMVEPTAALDGIVRGMIRPLRDRLLGIVREIAGPRLRARSLDRAVYSIVGQCLFYKHAEPVLRRLGDRPPSGTRELDALADHITAFSLEGLRGRRP